MSLYLVGPHGEAAGLVRRQKGKKRRACPRAFTVASDGRHGSGRIGKFECI